MYQGGKTSVARDIAAIIERASEGATRYVEPFIGSAAVTTRVAPLFEEAYAADLSPDLVMMWQALIDGWEPPTVVTIDEYEAQRTAEPSALRAFVGFPCSFGGKWFGGYARDPRSDRDFAATAARSVVKRAATMRNMGLWCADYRELMAAVRVDACTVVYADPPYADTTGYRAAGSFDSVAFWQEAEWWAMSGARVLVSEYTAPAGWVKVWAKERHVSTALDNSAGRATECLYASPETAGLLGML